MSRIRTLIILFLIILWAVPSFAQFVDVPKTSQAYPAVQDLVKAGIIKVPANKKFNGKGLIDMYQLAYVLDQLLAYTGKIKQIEARPLEGFYYDIPHNHYAYKAIRDMVKLGVFKIPATKQFKGQFRINRYTFYSYFAAFLERIEEKKFPVAPFSAGYNDVPKDNPAYLYIQKLVGAGILSGKVNLKGTELITRFEMAIFVSRILNYYLPGEEKAEAKEVKETKGYIDIPKNNYAAPAVGELIEAGILPQGQGEKFYGEDPINRYLLTDFISKIIERIILEGEGELEMASPAQSYKDVPVSNFAYRSIQRLISLGIVPPGNRRELFYGDRRITRYQMAFFVFSAIEKMLEKTIIFKTAPPALGYSDVPEDYFVYNMIQKLIWLGVLEGGSDQKFSGEEYVDRYELCYFTVNLIKAVFVKLEEIEEVVYEAPVYYGFNTYLSTALSASHLENTPAAGQGTTDLSATQTISLYLDRDIHEILSVFASMTSSYDFGGTTVANPQLDQAYALFDLKPWLLQVGRTSYYQGYTPFGNSLYLDGNLDMIFGYYNHDYFTVGTGIGKLAYLGDLRDDSNVGTISLSPRLPGMLSWLEFSLASSLITDLPDQGFTQTLNTSVTQTYGGLKANLFNLLEFTAEMGNLNFNNPTVLSTIGLSSTEGFDATQVALTYYSEDFGYSVSIGYQKIGSSYYLSTFADPTSFMSTEQNSEALLGRTTYYPSPGQIIGADLAYISQNGYNYKSAATGYYNFKVFEGAYVNLSLTRVMDNMTAAQNQFSAASSFAVTF